MEACYLIRHTKVQPKISVSNPVFISRHYSLHVLLSNYSVHVFLGGVSHIVFYFIIIYGIEFLLYYEMNLFKEQI